VTEVSLSTPSSFGEFALGLLGISAGIGIAVTAATFVVGAYLVMFGLPVAMVLGRHLHSPWALTVALLDAGAGALFAVTGNRIGALEGDGPSLLFFLLVLSFALPAGYLYRQGVVMLREQAAIFNGF
jgi:hypothetical protein